MPLHAIANARVTNAMYPPPKRNHVTASKPSSIIGAHQCTCREVDATTHKDTARMHMFDFCCYGARRSPLPKQMLDLGARAATARYYSTRKPTHNLIVVRVTLEQDDLASALASARKPHEDREQLRTASGPHRFGFLVRRAPEASFRFLKDNTGRVGSLG